MLGKDKAGIDGDGSSQISEIDRIGFVSKPAIVDVCLVYWTSNLTAMGTEEVVYRRKMQLSPDFTIANNRINATSLPQSYSANRLNKGPFGTSSRDRHGIQSRIRVGRVKADPKLPMIGQCIQVKRPQAGRVGKQRKRRNK
jgi:hypothetical protein